MRIRRLLLIMIASLVIIPYINNIGKAEEEAKIRVVQKTVNGEVGGIGPDFIAVTYDVDEKAAYEIAFNLDKEVKFRNKKSLKEINLGDTVSVRYEETIEEKGKEMRVLKRQVKEIIFLKPAPKEPESSLLRSNQKE